MHCKISFFIIILTVLKQVKSQCDCYENEIFTTLVNPCNSCEIRGFCPIVGPGCDCYPGYFRNCDGVCVPPEECDKTRVDPNVPDEFEKEPPSCGPNEEYNECGSACPPTCDNPNPGPCEKQCVAGCCCKQGFLKKGKTCVPASQCSAKVTPKPEEKPGGIAPRRNYNPIAALPPPPPPPVLPPAPAYAPARPPSHPPLPRPVPPAVPPKYSSPLAQKFAPFPHPALRPPALLPPSRPPAYPPPLPPPPAYPHYG